MRGSPQMQHTFAAASASVFAFVDLLLPLLLLLLLLLLLWGLAYSKMDLQVFAQSEFFSLHPIYIQPTYNTQHR